ncbi:MAG TPA: class I SAM-dependent methyltransferase [Bacteroidales bacterium]|nr:class I SAM-dependent methyltransferase [Bacteroidales bacterium]
MNFENNLKGADKYQISEPKCRICGNSKGNKIFTAKERQFGTLEEFNYFTCSSCGCIQILDFPKNPGKYYPAYYYAYDQPVFPTKLTGLLAYLKKSLLRYYIGYFNIPGFILSLVYKHPFPWIRKKEINFNSRILDVGCGSGRKLLSLYRSGFRNLTGIDPYIEKDIIYPEGVIIRKMELSDMQGEFDFIMLHHSFEHMPDPKNVLYHINRLLAPEGSVLIRIPVADSASCKKYGEYWSGLDAPRHFFIHTRKSIEILAENTGFFIDGLSYDSTRDQFVTSEKYLRGLPKNSPDSIFSRSELKKFDREAEKLNKLMEGDWACFYLRKKTDKKYE